jgi:hypothetical protein
MLGAKDLLDFIFELPTNVPDGSPHVSELVLALPFAHILESDPPHFGRKAHVR